MTPPPTAAAQSTRRDRQGPSEARKPLEWPAQGVATNRVPLAAPTDRVRDVHRALIGGRYESASMIVVCENSVLCGLVPVEDLLAAADDDLVGTVMDPDPPRLSRGLDQELVARQAVRRGESSLVVVDDRGRFLGLIPPARLLGVLLEEHGQVMARLGGYLHSIGDARSASQERVTRRFRHRLPWLVLGLLGALLAAGIVESFERVIQAQLLLASFLPGVVYMADAVGTQTETLVIRGLSVGVPVAGMAWREAVTGLLVGGALAAAFVPVGLWLWQEPAVVGIAALALFAACAVATGVATALPALLQRLGLDPAFGSGPLATVIQDLLSIVIYLGLAVAILG